MHDVGHGRGMSHQHCPRRSRRNRDTYAHTHIHAHICFVPRCIAFASSQITRCLNIMSFVCTSPALTRMPCTGVLHRGGRFWLSLVIIALALWSLAHSRGVVPCIPHLLGRAQDSTTKTSGTISVFVTVLDCYLSIALRFITLSGFVSHSLSAGYRYAG